MKVQKNPEKNITSEKINKIIPILSPNCTKDRWFPWKVDSRVTSRHQKNLIDIKIKKENKKLFIIENLNQ